MGIEVRSATPNDVEPAFAVYLAANEARRGGRPTPDVHRVRVMASMSSPGRMLLLAVDGEECVGIALAMPAREDDGAGPPVPGLLFISLIFVRPDRWGEGIGAKLTEAVLAEAAEQGYRLAQLWTHADNVRSQRLYERLGFRRPGREKLNDIGELIVLYERAVVPANV